MLLNEKFGMRSYAVLVVEDNADDERLTVRGLRDTGLPLNVAIARDGAEALLFLLGDSVTTGLGTSPRLVLLDLKLPKMSGLQVLKALREDSRTASIPIVCLTSSDEVSDAIMAYGTGANSFVRKPIDYAEYKEAIAQTANYWLKLNYWPA